MDRHQLFYTLRHPKLLLLGILSLISTSESAIWGMKRPGTPHFPARRNPFPHPPSPNDLTFERETGKATDHYYQNYHSKSPSSSSSLQSNGVEHPSLNFLSEETYTPSSYLKKSHSAFGLMKTSRPPPAIMRKPRRKATSTRLPFSIMNNGKQIEAALVIERPPMATLNLKRPMTTTTTDYYHQSHQYNNPLKNRIIP